MPSYRVEFTEDASKDLDKIAPPWRGRILAKTLKLAEDPRPARCKKLVGADRLWRIRIGDYRVIYEIADNILVVTVVKIGHRSDIYR